MQKAGSTPDKVINMNIIQSVNLLTSNNFPVFPLAPFGWKAVIKKWPERASVNLATYASYWRRNHNIGIATGKWFIVVDVDSEEHGGKYDGIATYNAIKDEFPLTLTVRTPSGGLHLYYRTTPEQIEELDIKTRSAWLPGIDIRSNGGYVVGPGSVKKEGTYDIILPRLLTVDDLGNIPLNPLVADLPIDLFTRVKARADKQKKAKTSAATSSITSSLITSETSQFSSMPEIVPMGQRDEILFKYACSWRERGYPYDHAKVLMQALHAKCESSPVDPITLADAMEKLDRAWKQFVPGERAEPPSALVDQPESLDTTEVNERPTTIEDALARYIYVEELDSVADLRAHPKQAITKLNIFKTSHKNCRFNGREMSTMWLANRHRQIVRDTIYWPHSRQIITYQNKKFFNNYTGAELENVELKDVSNVKIHAFLGHMKYMFPREEDYQLIMSWMIFTVTVPQKRIPWAPLLISKPGVGKSWLYLLLCKLMGEDNCSLIRDTDLESNFNGFLSEKTLVCLDDVEKGKQLQLALNSMLTAPTLTINHKYGKTGTERMFFNFICFTNPGRAIALQQNDRRFWVNNIAAAPRPDSYYTLLFNWLESDGPAHLYQWMKRQDLSGFSYAAPPAVSAAKEDMIEASLGIFEEIIFNAINEETGPFIADIVDASVVELYIKAELGRDNLSNTDIMAIRKALARFATKLPIKRYRVKLIDSAYHSKLYSLRVVRDSERWCSALTGDVIEEFKRGYREALGIKK